MKRSDTDNNAAATKPVERQNSLEPDRRLANEWAGNGRTYLQQSRTRHAISCFSVATRLDPDNDELLELLNDSYRRHAEVTGKFGSTKPYIGALERNKDVAATFHPLLLDFFLAIPGVDAALKAAQSTEPVDRESILDHPGLARLIGNRHFLAFLTEMLVFSIDLETLITAARHSVLVTGRWRDDDPAVSTEFLCALGQQCLNNEYVFDKTGVESALIAGLEDEIQIGILTTGTVSPRAVAMLAAYRPLIATAFHQQLLERAGQNHPQDYDDLLTRHIREPLMEREIAARTPHLTPISSPTSGLVREMYEDNPFPRWQLVRKRNPKTLGAQLIKQIPGLTEEDLRFPEPTTALIAGCGTGQQSVRLALSYPDLEFVAFDLSLSSLARAQRRHRELGLDKVRFYHGDILALADLPDHYEVIFCCGVLHHLADPAEGWRILSDKLRPGGVMFVSVYSRAGRRRVNHLREFAKDGGFGDSANEIRRCRAAMMALPKDDKVRRHCAAYENFFSTSMFRDLVLHPVEHQTSLLEIGEVLKQTGLGFLGVPRGRLKPQYRHLADKAPRQNAIEYWLECEQKDPDTFGGMHRIWLRKPL